MTPKQKAKELVNKINNGLWEDRGISVCSEIAIYCALIAVDEILDDYEAFPYKAQTGKEYWQECKKEIEKL